MRRGTADRGEQSPSCRSYCGRTARRRALTATAVAVCVGAAAVGASRYYNRHRMLILPLSALLLSLFAERREVARSVTQVDEAIASPVKWLSLASSYPTYPPSIQK
jgi:hypothetical protein